MATVLVMNDDVDLVGTCKLILEAEGHTVIAETSPEEGLRTAARARPDVILLDWVMRGMNGDEAFRRLRRDRRTADVPVVMMSAIAHGAARAAELGADAFLAKPFGAEELVQTIDRVLLASKRMRAANE